MDPLLFAVMLGASLLHAGWHSLVKSSGNGIAVLAGMNLVSGACALALLPAAGTLTAPVYAVLCASVLLHLGYKMALARLYRLADLAQAFPLARGLTPLVATLLAFALLNECSSPTAQVGLLLISIGLGSLALEQRRTRVSRQAALAALMAGTTAGSYAVLDGFGLRLSGDWFASTVWLVAIDSTVFVLVALTMNGRAVLTEWRSGFSRVLAAGLFGTASFTVFMWALSKGPIGPVSALRESSVLFSVLIGAIFLREPLNPTRGAAAAGVITGIALIALGG